MKIVNKAAHLAILAVVICVLLAASDLQVCYKNADAFTMYHGTTTLNPNGLLSSPTAIVVNQNGTAITNVPTYRAVIADLSPAASATDVTTVCGAAGKLVKITQVEATADATSAGTLDFYTFVRAASDVGGTSAVVSAASLDSTAATPTAVVTKFTANPSSLGTGTMLAATQYALPAAVSTGYPFFPWRVDFGTRNTQPLVLRGANQCFAFGFNGQTIPAGTILHLNIEWTEE